MHNTVIVTEQKQVKSSITASFDSSTHATDKFVEGPDGLDKDQGQGKGFYSGGTEVRFEGGCVSHSPIFKSVDFGVFEQL